ncbi:zf-HC2 domain-containing protein [bacterium]|nr:zf-HC2 domain-containing protein [bacterium]
MNCKKITVLISEYIDNTLAGHIRTKFEAHIRECSDCAERLASMERMLASLKSLKTEETPIDCWAGVKSRIMEGHGAREGRQPWILRSAYAVPAFAFVMVLILLLVLPVCIKNDRSSVDPASMPEYAQCISAHSRAQRQQILGDPHVTFIAAEMENASLSRDSNAP